MPAKVYVIQKTNRHVIKRIDSVTKVVDASFGSWGVPGTDATHLNFPKGTCIDGLNNIFIADRYNHRIVMLDSNLVPITFFDMTPTIFEPILLYFSGIEIIIVGNSVNNLMFGKMPMGGGAITYFSPVGVYVNEPTGIVDVAPNLYAVTGIDNNLTLINDDMMGSFINLGLQSIIGQPDMVYTGICKVGSDYYLNSSRQIIRMNASFINNGDSDRISKPTYISATGLTNSILIYDAQNQIIKRYDNNLNFIEDVFIDTGSSLSDDAYDVVDVIEANVP